jgi:hypothetical protein
MAFLATSAQDSSPNAAGKGKRQQARDTGPVDGMHSPAPHHPYRRSGAAPSQSFRANAAEHPQTLCIVCLRRPHPNMGECREETLSDGEPAFSTCGKLGQLTDRQGKALCVDFQLPKSCSSKRHGTCHRCASCSAEQHGAAECPRRSAN